MVKKSNWILIAFMILSTGLKAQVAEDRYLVYFTDKINTPFSVNEPGQFLSERSIQRRINQGIAITEQDLPVDPDYIQNIQNLGEVEIIYPLKWFNAILIETTDPDVIQGIEDLENVERLEASTWLQGYNPVEEERLTFQAKSGEEYGPSLNQIEMINGIPLHEDGFTGENLWVGVLDGGFQFTNTAAALSDFFNSERLLDTYNFVDGNDDVFLRSTHGTRVLSTMTGFMEDSLIGTGYGASYGLFITEDVTQERRIEEANWTRAAEYADSAGYDILNTSLGYTVFDVIEDNYTYADMDGGTTLITRASDIAASKGMLIVTSAGNSGNNNWFFISAPADGDSVLAVGAVDPEAMSASFSSRGPSFDGRVKPNVCAQGGSAVFTDLGDGISAGNGTSFSSPIIAGMAASLWQAYPQATSWQIHQSIEQSAHLYTNPNDSLGFGIPDFEIARDLLGAVLSKNEVDKNAEITVFPNPLSRDELLSIKIPSDAHGQLLLRIFSARGKLQFSRNFNAAGSEIYHFPLHALGLAGGIFILELRDSDGKRFRQKVILK